MYVPSQPRFLLNERSYCESKQSWSIENNMQIIFFQFRLNITFNQYDIPVVPDGCIDIIFSCDLQNPSVCIFGKLTKFKIDMFDPNTTYFGIRLASSLNSMGL